VTDGAQPPQAAAGTIITVQHAEPAKCGGAPRFDTVARGVIEVMNGATLTVQQATGSLFNAGGSSPTLLMTSEQAW